MYISQTEINLNQVEDSLENKTEGHLNKERQLRSRSKIPKTSADVDSHCKMYLEGIGEND